MNKKVFGYYLSITVAFLLSACARPPLIPTAPADSRICCKSLADLPMQDLPSGKVISVTFDAEKSPVFAFPEGNGVFAAFRIPENLAGATLKVRSFFSTFVLPNATMVRPNVMFLDASYTPIRVPRETPLRMHRGGVWGMSSYGVFQVPPGAAYSVVYSGDPRSKRVMTSSENGTMYAIPYSYSGDVDVLLQQGSE